MQIKIEQDLEFEFSDFNWNKYELEDGTILKAIYIPNKIFRVGKDEFNVPQYLTGGRVLLSAYPLEESKGEPNIEPFDPIKHASHSIEFVAKEENWNIFELSDGNSLKIKLIITKVRKAEHYNAFREPVYHVSHNLSFATVENNYMD